MDGLMYRVAGHASTAVAVVISLAILTGCGDVAKQSTRYSDSDPEYQLAVIDGKTVPSDSDIKPYDAALTALRRKCHNTRREISDYAVRAQQMMRENGSSETSLLTILKGIGDAIPKNYPRRDCSEQFALFVTITKPK